MVRVHLGVKRSLVGLNGINGDLVRVQLGVERSLVGLNGINGDLVHVQLGVERSLVRVHLGLMRSLVGLNGINGELIRVHLGRKRRLVEFSDDLVRVELGLKGSNCVQDALCALLLGHDARIPRGGRCWTTRFKQHVHELEGVRVGKPVAELPQIVSSQATDIKRRHGHARR
jgi:hypothetical protein